MAEGPLKLYWNDQFVGHVTDAGWSDFPEEFAWGWRMVKADGTELEISQPIVDFATATSIGAERFCAGR